METKVLKSFLSYPADHPFPIQNIPFGVFTANKDHQKKPKCGTRIGDFVIDLEQLENKGFLNGEKLSALKKEGKSVFSQPALNDFMSLGRPYWREVRETLQQLFSENGKLKDDMDFRNIAIHDYRDVTMCLPCRIGDYTDFYSSKNHAFNVGSIIRGPENALQANWTRLPVAYHGRCSSINVSGTEVRRPSGQVKPKDSDDPIFTPTQRLDFELEMGAFFGGPGNQIGHPIKCAEAEDRIFGLVLLNDWSARDIQAWEYVPLGPFLAKNFSTVISPWIVTLDALEPFRVQLPKQDPEPLPYLKDPKLSSYDLKLDVLIQPSGKDNKEKIATSNFKYLYWSVAQQLAHHTVTGCNMNPGDLLGSGTISGTDKSEYGSLLELTWGGRDPVKVGDETRVFLKDGDNLVLDGYCDSQEGYRIGFGECASKVLPALDTKEFY